MNAVLFYTTYATLWQDKTELAVHEWVKLIGEACTFKISDRPTLKTQRDIHSRCYRKHSHQVIQSFFGEFVIVLHCYLTWQLTSRCLLPRLVPPIWCSFFSVALWCHFLFSIVVRALTDPVRSLLFLCCSELVCVWQYGFTWVAELWVGVIFIQF